MNDCLSTRTAGKGARPPFAIYGGTRLLLPCRRVAMFALLRDLPLGVARGRLIRGMQHIEERDDGRNFCWVQVLAIGRHVAAALRDLADESNTIASPVR